ncbi:MAG: hypothetical protein C4K58_01500 [Flavobacteriaceae bacterium]|nr:MAG: hypothetical protein C4K58_01500 [Flavobacteriaceae bacterium]
MENTSYPENIEEEIDLKELIAPYLRSWPWFVFGALVSLALAFVYLRYASPMYQANASLLIKNKEEGGASALTSQFEDMGLLTGGASANLIDEIEIIQSKSLLERVISKNDFQHQYAVQGNIKKTEIFPSPIQIEILKENQDKKTKESLILEKIDGQKFEISNEDHSQTANFGKPFTFPEIGTLIVSKKGLLEDASYSINLNSFDQKSAKSSLVATVLNEKGNIISLSIKGENKEKLVSFLDKLIEKYNQESIEDKSLVNNATEKFLNERIELLTADLGVIEKEAEDFKTNNNLTDIQSEAGIFLENSNEFRKKSLESETRLEVMQTLLNYISSSGNDVLIPSNIGLTDPGLASMIATYNETFLERNRLLSSSSHINPVVAELDRQLADLKSTISQSLQKQKNAEQINLNTLKGEEEIVNGKIASIPKQERIFRNIQRQREIKENLYLFLLTKREENGVSQAITEPQAKVIDAPYALEEPIAPKKSIILLSALLLGLLVPFLLVYLKELMDTKVHHKKSIEKLTSTPVYASIVKNSTGENIVVNKSSVASEAESFRILRSSVDLVLQSLKPDHTPVVFVTSTIPKEGKSFVSSNLAMAYAITEKKVLYIGLDIRNPKVGENFDIKSDFGFVNYVLDSDLTLEKITQKNIGNFGLDAIVSGPIPPNPAELLLHPRVEEFFKEIESMNYDIIVVDTAPTAPVVDTSLITQFADAILYTVRSEYTEKSFSLNLHDFRDKLKKETALGIVLNAVDTTKGYGYGYGYGYGQTKEVPWWKKPFVKNS